MKNVILLLLASICFTSLLHGQKKSIEHTPSNASQPLDKAERDPSLVLNTYEAAYLNSFFEKQRGSFSFEDKAVLFLTGGYGSIKSTKSTFFSDTIPGVSIGDSSSHRMQQLIIFNQSERKSIGCDAVVITGSKKYLTKKDVIRSLRKFRKEH